MNITALSASFFVALGTVGGLGSNAYASTAAAGHGPGGPATASFEGRTINLASGWDGAKACLIWRSHGVAECFATEAGLAAREQQLRPPSTPATNAAVSPDVSTCSSELDLYSGSSYTGLHLALWDEGYWQELSDYGFDNLTRSFLGGACSFHLAQGDYGQGYWYPGDTGAWAFAADMGTWDGTVSSVYIT